MSTTRDAALRAALVDRVGHDRPRRWRLPLLGIGAFVVAGALTGGAVVGTALLQQTSTAQETSTVVDSGAVGYVRFLSARVARVADGPTTLQPPARPDGATRIAIAGECSGTMRLRVSVDGERIADVACGQVATLVRLPSGAAGSTLAVVPSHAGGFTVWAGWAEPDPLPGPSAQQRSETADGVATRSEYLAAFNRYLGCMRGAGHPLGTISQSATTFLWGIPDGAVVTSDRCSASEFQDVDALWQAEHPDGGAEHYDAASDDPRYAR